MRKAVGQLMVFSNAVAGYEKQFNDWYDHIHISEVKRVAPEIISAKRFNLTIISIPSEQRDWQYLTIYEVPNEYLNDVLERINAAIVNGEMNISDAAEQLSSLVIFADEMY
ncbi:MAG: hypothetical protein WCY88_17205 [Spongiibacteraceae bacterium]|jgi:hypothetical protein